MNFVNLFSYIATALAIYFFFKMLWLLFDYIVFKVIVNETLALVEEATKWKKVKNNAQREDNLSKNKTKEQKKLVEVERKMASGEELEVDEAQYRQPAEKIIGVAPNKTLLGLNGFVKKLFSERYETFKNLDPQSLRSEGFWQALEKSRQAPKQQGVDNGPRR